MDNTELYRLQCEARYVLRMTKRQREAHYAGMLEKRKQSGVDYLDKEVRRLEAKNREIER